MKNKIKTTSKISDNGSLLTLEMPLKKEANLKSPLLTITHVIKSDATKEVLSLTKIKKSIELAGKDTKAFNKKAAKAIFQKVILLLSQIKKKTITTSQIRDIVEPVMAEAGYFKTAKYYILFKERKEQAKKEEFRIWEPVMDDNAKLTLVSRCSKLDKKGNPIETPAQIFWRVSRHIAKAEINWADEKEVEETAKSFFERMAKFKFICTRSALYEAGNDACLQQLSPCFVLPIEDSIPAIFKTLGEAALIQKNFGGTGFNFSNIRYKGDKVRNIPNAASGPVDFLQVYSAALGKVVQGAKRHGGNMGILNVSHPDIYEFISIKDTDGNMKNFNISVGATNEFMEAVIANKQYTLKNPRDGRTLKRVSARKLFHDICEHAWKTGDPGMIFLDRVEEDNFTPSLGIMNATNPCVTGDTLISTDQGLIRIKDLADRHQKIKVLTDDRLSKNQWYQPLKVFKTGIKEVYKLITKEGYTVDLTKDHQLLTDSGWKPVSEIKVGEKILISNQKGGFGNKGNLELGRVLGWLVGDGTMKATEAILSFFGSEKTELVPQFVQMVNQVTEGSQKLARSYAVTGTNVIGRDEARIKSIRLWRIANEMGITHENKLKVPEIVFLGTEDMQRGFLQALFSADGHVSGDNSKGLSVRLTSISYELLVNVQRLLINFGIASRIYQNRRNKALRSMPDGKGGNREYWCSEYHDLSISKDNLWKFAREIGFLITYKNAKLVDRLKNYIEGTYGEKFESHFEKLIKLGKQTVYDMVEPVTHSFVANGIVVHNCGEQPLLPYESCNLSSIHLGSHVVKKNFGWEIDWDDLAKTTKILVRFLDDMIETNYYVLPETEKMVKYGNRKIGLGVIGFAEVLMKLGIPYNSAEGVRIADKIAKFIKNRAEEASSELAKVRGVFPNWDISTYKGTAEKYRNCTMMTIAPTGTVSMIGNTTSGIEPSFALVYTRRSFYNEDHQNKSTKELYYVDPNFERELRERGLYSKELLEKVADNHGSLKGLKEIPADLAKTFVTTHDIAPEWHVKIQAAFQKYVDNAVSKTINFANAATVKDIEEAYLLAWKLGCKGITIYRDGSKDDQVLNAGTTVSSKKETKSDTQTVSAGEQAEKCPECGGVLEFEGGCVTCRECGWSKCKI